MKRTISTFAGAVLAMEPKLLGDTVGIESRNQKPGRGDFRPWREPKPVATAPNGTKTIYRMGRSLASDALYWLTWPNVVHAIHGFVSSDTTERTFYTGDGPPKQTNTAIGLAGPPYPSAWRNLGVPAPAQALLVTSNNNGSGDAEIRYYTYTYVTSYGEESAPAPVSAQVSCKSDDTLNITNVAAPPAGSYGINRIRFYRTQTGTAGDTEFFFLREELSTVLNTTDDGRALGEVLPTDGWLPPPADLRNLTAMWNGIAAGIVDSDGSVRYCIAYKPYAWPISQETIPPNAKAVALGVFGQSLLILTTGKPVLVSGSSPDSLDEQPLEMNQACVASRSAVSMGHGVAWAAPDGLAYFGASGPKVVTTGILTREQWQAMRPSTMTGAAFEGAYFGSYLDAGNVRRGFFIDCINPAGIFMLDAGYESVFWDDSQDALYVLDGTSIKRWDEGSALMQARHTSGTFQGTEANYSAARVEADGYPITFFVDALELPAPVIADRMAARPDLFTNPEPGVLRYTTNVNNRQPFKMPGQFTARLWRMGVQTAASGVQWASMATSLDELV